MCRSQNGFYNYILHSGESGHAECEAVYICMNPITPSAEEFISLTLNIWAKKWKLKSNRHQILY